MKKSTIGRMLCLFLLISVVITAFPACSSDKNGSFRVTVVSPSKTSAKVRALLCAKNGLALPGFGIYKVADDEPSGETGSDGGAENAPGSAGLSLSLTPDFSEPLGNINMEIANNCITNIDGTLLPAEALNGAHGIHNDYGCLALTFYLSNSSTPDTISADAVSADIGYRIYISEAEPIVSKAIRIRLYINPVTVTEEAGEKTYSSDALFTDYAAVAADGNNEPGTVAFIDDETVCLDTMTGISPGDIIKITVVIWIEGYDPECTDVILCGKMQMGMELWLAEGPVGE